MTTWISIALLVFAAIVPVETAAEDGCRAFLLKEVADGVTVEVIPMADGATQVVPMGRDSENIAFLLHVGPGMSGSVEQRSAPPLIVMAVARCIDGELRVTYRRDDGTERAMPPVDVAEWAQYDMRVSVTGASGVRQAFRIRSGQTVEGDAGPVIDMFGGRIPMQPGDYAITTEVTQHEEIPTVAGSAPLHFNGAHFFVPVRLADGTEAEFVVDFGGGGRSVVSQAFLPDGLAVHEVVGVEHSAQGRRTVPASMQGLGGNVDQFRGQATLPRVHVGDVTFADVDVWVIEAMPDIGGRRPAGILALDLLRRADVVSIDYAPEGRLVWGSGDAMPDADAIEVPFTLAYRHLFVEGAVDGVPVSFVFDTGAHRSYLAAAVAQAARLKPVDGTTGTARGLDAQAFDVSVVEAGRLHLGEHAIPLGAQPLSFRVSEGRALPVLQAMGLQDRGGILGNDILQTFRRVEVDFARQQLRLIP